MSDPTKDAVMHERWDKSCENIENAMRAIYSLNPDIARERSIDKAREAFIQMRTIEKLRDEVFICEAFSEMTDADILAIGALSAKNDMPSEAAIGRIVSRGIMAYARKVAEIDAQWKDFEGAR